MSDDLKADTTERVTIATIPSGQSLELLSAVLAFFDSALADAVMAPGDGAGIAARLLAKPGQDHRQVAEMLRRATVPRDTSDVPDIPTPDVDDPITLNSMSKTDDGGVQFGLGATGEASRWAARLLAVFLPAFDEMGADNYIEYEGVDRKSGKRMLLIAVKPGGKRPSELRAAAEAERDELKRKLEELSDFAGQQSNARRTAEARIDDALALTEDPEPHVCETGWGQYIQSVRAVLLGEATPTEENP